VRLDQRLSRIEMASSGSTLCWTWTASPLPSKKKISLVFLGDVLLLCIPFQTFLVNESASCVQVAWPVVSSALACEGVEIRWLFRPFVVWTKKGNGAVASRRWRFHGALQDGNRILDVFRQLDKVRPILSVQWTHSRTTRTPISIQIQ
jgi:hypothetical protein